MPPDAANEPATDVLVVGAGPTGLTLAGELLRRGVGVRLIDRAAAPPTTSRALGLQPRTLEHFDAMGIIDRVLATGGPVSGANLYRGDRLLVGFDAARIDGLHTPYPSPWVTPQASVERPLAERLAELGGRVERNRTLIDFADDGDGVVATVGPTGGDAPPEPIRARWLVGCDGAHSRVRKLLGLAFAGSTLDETFLLADLEIDWDRARDRTHTWFPSDGMLAAFPLPGTSLWRLFAVMERADPPEPSLDLFRALFRERTGDAQTTLANPVWMSAFTINRRMVDRYRVGRVFVAGDAAHVHSPFGGQGMNTGIQDARNLAWKLAMAATGTAPDRLLATYDAERRPVAAGVLEFTGASTGILLSDHPLARLLRERVLSLDPVQGWLARRGSQLLVGYRSSPLSEGAWSAAGPAVLAAPVRSIVAGLDRGLATGGRLRSGDRAPDGDLLAGDSGAPTTVFRQFRGVHWTLLAFLGSGDADPPRLALPDGVRVVPVVAGRQRQVPAPPATHLLLDPSGSVHARYGATRGALVLVRPDGYVGFHGPLSAVSPLRDYLRAWFGLAAPAPAASPAPHRAPAPRAA